MLEHLSFYVDPNVRRAISMYKRLKALIGSIPEMLERHRLIGANGAAVLPFKAAAYSLYAACRIFTFQAPSDNLKVIVPLKTWGNNVTNMLDADAQYESRMVDYYDSNRRLGLTTKRTIGATNVVKLLIANFIADYDGYSASPMVALTSGQSSISYITKFLKIILQTTQGQSEGTSNAVNLEILKGNTTTSYTLNFVYSYAHTTLATQGLVQFFSINTFLSNDGPAFYREWEWLSSYYEMLMLMVEILDQARSMWAQSYASDIVRRGVWDLLHSAYSRYYDGSMFGLSRIKRFVNTPGQGDTYEFGSVIKTFWTLMGFSSYDELCADVEGSKFFVNDSSGGFTTDDILPAVFDIS